MMSSSSSKKRTRASPEQLAILEETFQNNTSPNSKMRELLGEKLGMNERSIQIWFQNRRAKVKLMQKRAQSPHDPHAAMRQQSMFAATYGIFGNAAAGGVGASSANGGYLKPNMPMSRSQSVDFTGLQQLNMQQMTMPLKMGQEGK